MGQCFESDAAVKAWVNTYFKNLNRSFYYNANEESNFKTQYLQKYGNRVNTLFLYKIERRISSQCPFFSKQFSSPLQNEFEFCNLDQNAITSGVVRKIVQYFFFFLNKPILQLKCMNSRMF